VEHTSFPIHAELLVSSSSLSSIKVLSPASARLMDTSSTARELALHGDVEEEGKGEAAFCTMARTSSSNSKRASAVAAEVPIAVAASDLVGVKGYLCKYECFAIAKQMHIKIKTNEFKSTHTGDLHAHVREYTRGEGKQAFFYPHPVGKQDTTLRFTLRVVQAAEPLAQATGFLALFKSLKPTHAGKQLVEEILGAKLLSVLLPILASTKSLGLSVNDPRTYATSILNLYYLGCAHELYLMQDPDEDARAHEQARLDVLQLEAQSEEEKKTKEVAMDERLHDIIVHIGKYLDAAQWLYVCSSLPPPHTNDGPWSAWYLSKLVRKDGWTLLFINHDTKDLPNESKVPAFALLARKRTNKHGKEKKELLLTVRGTFSVEDWTIDLKEACVAIEYFQGPLRDLRDKANLNVKPMHGFAHKGMNDAADGMYTRTHTHTRKYTHTYIHTNTLTTHTHTTHTHTRHTHTQHTHTRTHKACWTPSI